MFFIFICTFNTVFSQWILKNPYFQDVINNAEWINNDMGLLIGKNNLIAKSINGGSNWVEINYGLTSEINYSNSLNFSKFFNAFSGIIGGRYFYKTTNAGQNWTFINLPYYLSNVYFFNENVWYAAKRDNERYLLYKTSNQGVNWIYRDTLPIQFNNYVWKTENTGFVADNSGNSIYSTYNGGLNWSLSLDCTGFLGIVDYKFENENNGIILHNNKISRTINSGVNWEQVPIPANGPLKILYYKNDTLIILKSYLNDFAEFLISRNNGVSFESKSMITPVPLTNLLITFSSEKNGIFIGNTGIIYKTTDFGNSFIDVGHNKNLQEDLKDLWVFNSQE